jgi:MoxR-like ATPase
MFSSDAFDQLYRLHRSLFTRLRGIADALDGRFADARPTIDALMLAVASGEPLLLVGPPGTGKSRIIRAFCELAGVTRSDGEHDENEYFEYLLTPFTEPGELFGFYDIAKAKEGKLVRLEDYTLQRARVVYLDEFFNGSSAILNSLLAVMNERRFHDRGEVKRVKLECLFAATNRIPETPELKAVFDRFLLRVHVENIPATESATMVQLLERGWDDTYRNELTLDENGTDIFAAAARFREALHQLEPKVDPSSSFFRAFSQAIQIARDYGLSEMSNRRLVKMTRLMAIHALYDETQKKGEKKRAKLTLARPQLLLIPALFLDRQDDEVMSKLEECCRSAELP